MLTNTRRRVLAWTLSTAAVAGAAGAAQPWSLTVLLQEGFPKQTRTNQQIEQINQAFGTDFDTWDDVANLNLGVVALNRVAPRWEVGFEVDYSRGSIDGEATVDTEAGPARLAFEQKYSIYADLLALTHFRLCAACEKVVPFALGGLGVVYEKDRTTLELGNDYFHDTLVRVDNDGWFPAATVGVGLDAYLFGRDDWYLQAGVAYFWGRLEHKVPASGSLVGPEVTADTDTTGPNVWLGVGFRF